MRVSRDKRTCPIRVTVRNVEAHEVFDKSTPSASIRHTRQNMNRSMGISFSCRMSAVCQKRPCVAVATCIAWEDMMKLHDGPQIAAAPQTLGNLSHIATINQPIDHQSEKVGREASDSGDALIIQVQAASLHHAKSSTVDCVTFGIISPPRPSCSQGADDMWCGALL